MKKHRDLILGGTFGGLYTALEFAKCNDPDFEFILVNVHQSSET
jgi:NADH dehydrogenase FAD-containing subunit